MSLRKERVGRYLQDELLVYGHIQQECDLLNLSASIPPEIIEICLSFYMKIHEILKWSRKYVDSLFDYDDDDDYSNNPQAWIEYSDDDKMVTKIKCDQNFYVLTNQEPVLDGIHCWRGHVKSIL